MQVSIFTCGPARLKIGSIATGLVGGEAFSIDASLIAADANKQRSIPGSEWAKERDPETASRAVREYMATLDDAAFGAATKVTPKFVSPSDPAAQWTGARCADHRSRPMLRRSACWAGPNDKFEDLPLARRHRGVSKDRRWQYRSRMTVLYSLFALRKDSGRPGPRSYSQRPQRMHIKKGRGLNVDNDEQRLPVDRKQGL
jgi:hypothetical protein